MLKLLPTLILVGLAIAVPSAAEAAKATPSQAVGVRCRNVVVGGWRATHVFADYISCRSVRTKLRRWLPRERWPRKRDGWNCRVLSDPVFVCSYPGRRNPSRSFTFWL